ncbi:MAG: relaxase domain-containing protein [Phycisphaerales bacterium]|nr:relaxase domain-containing protein [Phycisphaerales bacterium]
MLRIHQCRSAEAAQSYFTQGLAREDYYTEGQEIAGRWGGVGIDLLGLTPLSERDGVTRQAFVALTENRHPLTGDRLTQRTKRDRTIGYDFNFHAPKGVSVLHAIHGDDRIMEAFRGAVNETMMEIERDAAARVRIDGRQEDRVTGNLTWAEFVHLTARPTVINDGPDPHLHAHCFVFNSTFDGEEDRWKAAQFRQLVRDAPYYEAAFHARLAMSLRSIGYEIDRTATGWDLEGIPRSLVEKFSTRTREIESVAEELGITDPVAKGQLGARTRKGKDKEARISDLRASWDGRLNDSERVLLQRLSDGGLASDWGEGDPPETLGDGSSVAVRSVDSGIAHSFERKSTMPLRRVAAEALKVGVGHVGIDEIWKELDKRDLLKRTVRGQVMATTRKVLAEERELLKFAVDGKGTCSSVRDRVKRRKGEDWEIQDERLSPDQRRAVDHVLDSTDRVVAIRGAAGVGKTTMMVEAVEAIRAGGQPVVVVAPTAEAARGQDSLRQKGFPGADTVAKLLDDNQMQQGLKNKSGGGVLWVDEAGLLGVGTMKQLFELADKHGARVVLSGDERQHKPVERGDALRVLQRLGGIDPVELTTIRRQRGLYRDAVMALSENDLPGGVEKLKELDAFREIEDVGERERAVAKEYVETLALGRSSVVVSPTHIEGGRIADEIRQMQRESGVLRGEDREVLRLRDLGWTEAQRQDVAQYEEGQVVHFHQGAKGAVAGDRCVVLGRQEREDGSEAVRARTPRGVEIDLPLGNADRFQVYRQEKMSLAVGDRVRVTKNGWTADRESKLTNGTLMTVGGFTKHGGIKLVGDRRGVRPKIVPAKYGHLSYGSVLTSHTVQGKDMDHVIVAQSAISAGASSAEQFYVSVSRGKQSVRVYTDDVDELIEAVGKSASRMSGMELESGIGLESKRRGNLRSPGIDNPLSKQVGQREAARRQQGSGKEMKQDRNRGRGKKPPSQERGFDRER